MHCTVPPFFRWYLSGPWVGAEGDGEVDREGGPLGVKYWDGWRRGGGFGQAAGAVLAVGDGLHQAGVIGEQPLGRDLRRW